MTYTIPRLSKPYREALKGDWDAMKKFYDESPAETISEPLTVSNDNAVHVAVYSGQTELVKNLLEKYPDAMIKKNDIGDTVLHEVASTGNVQMAKDVLLVNQIMCNYNLLEVWNERLETPLFRAAACGKTDMVRYLANQLTTFNGHLRRKDETPILHIAILCQYFETALELLNMPNKNIELAKMVDGNGKTCLQLLANMPSAFKSGTRLGKLERLVYFCLPDGTNEGETPDVNSSKRDVEAGTGDHGQTSQHSRNQTTGWPAIKELWDLKKKHELALKLVKILVKDDQSWMNTKNGMSPEKIFVIKGKRVRLTPPREIDASLPTSPPNESSTSGDDNGDPPKKNETPLLAAAEHGIIEIVKEILELYPQAVEHVNAEGANILHVAVRNRKREIFDFLQSPSIPMSRLRRRIDLKGNSLLHQAAELGDYQIRERPGEALHMQREIQWFEQVKEVVPPHFINHRNDEEWTAEDLFTKNHEELVKSGQEWLMSTAKSCSLVAVLIATVAFTSAYTIPGGPNQTTGHPVLLNKHPFLVFTISDTFSLSFALTSVVVFLSIMTSRFHEQDFHRSLPLKLVLGLTTLFLAVAAMMVAFAATLGLMIEEKLHWAAVPIYFLACCPVTIFLALQFPLYVSVAWFTLGDILRMVWHGLRRKPPKPIKHLLDQE